MFIVAQFIGLYVTSHYSSEDNNLPYGMEPVQPETETEYYGMLSQIIIAFIIAIALIFAFTRFRLEIIMKIWFFLVILIALGLTFTAFFPEFKYVSIIALLIALPFAIIKVFRRDMVIHNFTELLIYPGIAAVFVPILNVLTMIIFLVIISIYDMWAVWHSGLMQKMVKFQIEKVRIFAGFFIPYVSDSVRKSLKKLKKSELRKKKVKVNVALLGGGDVIFPIIASGVMFKALGIGAALLVILGAALGLAYIFFVAEKKKFYPAMPFITAGVLVGIGISYLIF